MKVFITGDSGFLGQRIIYRLLREGHEVIGLARSESSEEIIRIAGAVAVRGDKNKGTFPFARENAGIRST